MVWAHVKDLLFVCISSHSSGTDRGTWWQRFRDLQRTYPAFARGKLEGQHYGSHFVISDCWDKGFKVRFLQTLPSIFRVHSHILSFHFLENCSLLFYAPIFLSRTSALSPPSNTWNCRFVVRRLNLYCGNISAQRHMGKEKPDNFEVPC